jgi:DNA-binding IclR family transcriptional regulator
MDEAIIEFLKKGPALKWVILDRMDTPASEVEAALASLVERKMIKVASGGLYRIDLSVKLYD